MPVQFETPTTGGWKSRKSAPKASDISADNGKRDYNIMISVLIYSESDTISISSGADSADEQDHSPAWMDTPWEAVNPGESM